MTSTRGTGRHLWVTPSAGPSQPGSGRPLATVDAHRRLRGPYTAAGTLVRVLAPDAIARWPELVARHDVELLTVAPELVREIDCQRATLMATSAPEERTRYYPAAYTTRVAHGVTDFLVEHVRRTGASPCSVVIDNAEHADATDTELLAILLRRLDPGLLRLVIRTGGGKVTSPLAEALERYADQVTGSVPPAATAVNGQTRQALAASYVAGECLSQLPLLQEAYAALPAGARAALHDQRAEELTARAELSLTLGAIPFHRERGTDPTGAGAESVERALLHCTLHGLYEAAVDLGRRAFALLDWEAQPERCWLVTVKMCTALAALDRPEEAEELYEDACRRSTLPSIHLQSAYGRAMLYTRFYGKKRDHQRAKAWINTAIAIASLGSEQQRRAYNLTFQENGRALVEMHMGNLEESLRLVESGLRRMDEEVDPERYLPHRSVLTYNRAQLLGRLGRTEESVLAYTAVMGMDPNHSEYYVERADQRRRLGQITEAFEDYTTAIRLSPPYPQSYFNRGDLAMECGELEQAVADFGRVLELDPTLVDAYVSRASAYHELGKGDAAMRDIAAGLELAADQPHLHCLRGMIAQQQGRPTEAREAFRTALDLDPTLVPAWCNFGVLQFEDGDAAAAIDCFDRALELDDNPAVRGNRGLARQSLGHYRQAVEDYTAALAGDPHGGEGELLFRRAQCYLAQCHLLGDERLLAHADLTAYLASGETEHAEQARADLVRIQAEPWGDVHDT